MSRMTSCPCGTAPLLMAVLATAALLSAGCATSRPAWQFPTAARQQARAESGAATAAETRIPVPKPPVSQVASPHFAARPIEQALSQPSSSADAVTRLPPPVSRDPGSRIAQIAYQETEEAPVPTPLDVPRVAFGTIDDPLGEAAALLAGEGRPQQLDRVPIDLANALALGGASHLQIRLARERVVEAHANWIAAKTLWLPSLRLGVGWNKHEGRLQQTEGDVLQVSRNSLFVGGGAGLGDSPLAAGAGGPPRLFVALSLADAIFEPIVACRLLNAEQAATNSAFNDSLLAIATTYFQLVEARGLEVNAELGLRSAQALVRVTSDFEAEGAGSKAEVDRAKAELGSWQIAVEDARRVLAVRSAELIRLLRMDPMSKLTPADENVVPIDMIDPETSIEDLIGLGLSSRPELAELQSRVAASCGRVGQEHWRPWLPHVQVGTSGGSFGGGPESQFDNQGGRLDLDLLAVWEVRNMGYGNSALRQQRGSQARQASIQLDWMKDRVSAEVVAAFAELNSFRSQMQSAQRSIRSASDSYELNANRVRAGEGLPIELLQAIRARVQALNDYTTAATSYNQAQFRLLRAVGQPPTTESDQ